MFVYKLEKVAHVWGDHSALCNCLCMHTHVVKISLTQTNTNLIRKCIGYRDRAVGLMIAIN